LLLEGRIEEGLAELLAQRKSALADGWPYSASRVDFAAGPALRTGRIAEGIRMLKAGIAARDTMGDRSMASWNRVVLAELFLRMLSSEKRPSFKFLLSNLGVLRGYCLAKLFILNKKPQLARQHPRKAQLAAAAQESAIMLNEIDAIFASLR
jgi:hypothetical protein